MAAYREEELISTIELLEQVNKTQSLRMDQLEAENTDLKTIIRREIITGRRQKLL